MPNKLNWSSGNVVEIELKGAWAYGKVVEFPLMAFYPPRLKRITGISELLGESFAFRIWVMKYAISKKGWPLIGSLPVTAEESAEQWFFKRDPISGRISRYHGSTNKEIPATARGCAALECAAVWDPIHVESRLQDQFLGKPNPFVESLRAK